MLPSGKIVPTPRIRSPQELGTLVRERRRALAVTQVELAGLARVGPRFIGELERGKPTLELEKVLRVLDRLGLAVRIEPREAER
ncbi:MAG: helix-turn-helix transcriptional regulator [Myxococcales bacterium]|nr:helix-turn-helix transcriptional regulator [Myxococcales bacterium]